LAYSIASALASNIFDKIYVSTDSPLYAEHARSYGARVVMRPERYALGTSPDIEWVKYTIDELALSLHTYLAILRPTSPFRSAKTIRACSDQWRDDIFDSIRAVEPVSQHPGKMWVLHGDQLFPLMPIHAGDNPWHSSQMKTLPKVYVQNASLEMVSVDTVHRTKSIAGVQIQAFETEGWEGFDLNTEYDWKIAEMAVENGEAVLPTIL